MSRAHGCVAVFAKPPRPGEVKTRLVPDLGESGAAALARAFFLDTWASVSALNWSEVAQKARAHGVDVVGLREDLESLGVRIIPFAVAEAEAAVDIWRRGGQHLAMADRACLATAVVHGLTAMTADRAWTSLEVGAEVQAIR